MPRGPHGPGGRETGPARMEITRRPDGTYEATITVDRDLHATDAGDALGHELDEVAGLVHDNVQGPELARQQRAGLMRPTTAQRAPSPTVHDKAQVREFLAGYDRQKGTPEVRLAAMEPKLTAWGLREPAHLDVRLEFLRTQGVPEEIVRALHASVAATASIPKGGTAPLLSTERMEHVLYPEKGTSESMIAYQISSGDSAPYWCVCSR